MGGATMTLLQRFELYLTGLNISSPQAAVGSLMAGIEPFEGLDHPITQQLNVIKGLQIYDPRSRLELDVLETMLVSFWNAQSDE